MMYVEESLRHDLIAIAVSKHFQRLRRVCSLQDDGVGLHFAAITAGATGGAGWMMARLPAADAE